MIVEELIEELQKFDKRSEIYFTVDLKYIYDSAPYGESLVVDLNGILKADMERKTIFCLQE